MARPPFLNLPRCVVSDPKYALPPQSACRFMRFRIAALGDPDFGCPHGAQVGAPKLATRTSNTRPTHVQRMSNTRPTHVQHTSNTTVNIPTCRRQGLAHSSGAPSSGLCVCVSVPRALVGDHSSGPDPSPCQLENCVPEVQCKGWTPAIFQKPGHGATVRQRTVNIRSTYSQHPLNIQSIYSQHTANIPAFLFDSNWKVTRLVPAPVRLKNPVNIQSTYSQHSVNIQSTYS